MMYHKLFFKRSLLALIAYSAMLSMQPIAADNDLADVAKVVLSVAAASAVVYGGYKCYESASLGWAEDRLQDNQQELARLTANYSENLSEDRSIVAIYLDNQAGFSQTTTRVSRDRNQVRDSKDTTQRDIRAWRSTKKARDFVRKAEDFIPQVEAAEDLIERHERHLGICGHLLTLARLLRSEPTQPYASIADIHGVPRCYASSAWPFKQAADDLESRSQLYDRTLQNLGEYQSPYAHEQKRLGAGTKSELWALYTTIVASEKHVADRQAYQQHAQAQEAARIARIQAEAAQRQAAAAERQACAQEEQNRQHLEARLLALRTQLSGLNILRDAARGNAYRELERQRSHVINEILRIRHQLHDDNWFSSFFVGFVFDAY